jgi:hypothetical protein
VYGVDVEEHDPVEGTAQLGALAAEGLSRVLRIDPEVEDVQFARHGVALEQELRDVEGVDDVRRDRWTWTVRPAGTTIPPSSPIGRSCVKRTRPLIEVVERPLELSGDGPDVRVRVRRRRLDVFRVCHETTNRNATMTVGTTVQTTSASMFPCVCGGSSVVAGLAPVAKDRPDDESLDDEEDDDPDEEDDVVQLPDLHALLRHRGRRDRSCRPRPG